MNGSKPDFNPGRVILVGAGPGDPGLLTLRGQEALSQADVLVYDHLVTDQTLAHTSPHARRIYVGKVAGKHTMPQEAINELLVNEAQQGNRVVRLKGGDPFIFGRGGEECLALHEAGVPFEVVPGISAMAAVPAYAGIPLTSRDHATAFHVITGHEHAFKPNDHVDWKQAAQLKGTLVIFMGLYRLRSITDALMREGRSPDTPAAVVHWGTLPRQQTVSGTLATLADQVEHIQLRPPALLIIGEVVQLREALNWFERRALFGRHIAIPRPRNQQSRLKRFLIEAGAQVHDIPAQATPPQKPIEPDPLPDLEGFQGVLFPGPEYVPPFMRALLEQGVDARGLAGKKLIAVGSAVQSALRTAGLQADFTQDILCTAELHKNWPEQIDIRGQSILVPFGAEQPTALFKELRLLNAQPLPWQTLVDAPPASTQPHAPERFDAFAFPCASMITPMVKHMGEDHFREHVKHTAVAVTSAKAARRLRQLGANLIICPEEATVPAMVKALIAYLQRPQGTQSTPHSGNRVDMAQETR